MDKYYNEGEYACGDSILKQDKKQLYVQEIPLEMSSSKNFRLAYENSTISLDCIKSSENIKVDWKFCPYTYGSPDICESLLDPHKKYHSNIETMMPKENDPLKHKLTIRNVKEQNSGIYKCIGKKFGLTSKTIEIKLVVTKPLEIHGIIVNNFIRRETTNNIILYDDGRTKSFKIQCISESKPPPNKIYWNDAVYKINITTYRNMQTLNKTCTVERNFFGIHESKNRTFTIQFLPKLTAHNNINKSRTCIHIDEKPQCYDAYNELIQFGTYGCDESVQIENYLPTCPKPLWDTWSGCPGIALNNEIIYTTRRNLNCIENENCEEKYDFQAEICDKNQCFYKLDDSDRDSCLQSSIFNELYTIKYKPSGFNTQSCAKVINSLETMAQCNGACEIGFKWNSTNKTCEGKVI